MVGVPPQTTTTSYPAQYSDENEDETWARVYFIDEETTMKYHMNHYNYRLSVEFRNIKQWEQFKLDGAVNEHLPPPKEPEMVAAKYVVHRYNPRTDAMDIATEHFDFVTTTELRRIINHEPDQWLAAVQQSNAASTTKRPLRLSTQARRSPHRGPKFAGHAVSVRKMLERRAHLRGKIYNRRNDYIKTKFRQKGIGDTNLKYPS